MTDVPPPESPKPQRGRPRRQKGYEDEAVLTEDEVARRVDLRGGAAPRAPIERTPVRERRTTPRRPERTGARDSLLLIGLVIVGLVAVRLFLPDGPLTASATATPGGTQAAVASGTPTASTTSGPSGVLITLPPAPFVPTPSPGPVTEPPATATPAPTHTQKPGHTPAPTPKPTKTPTPPPTAAPTTATVIVIVNIVNNSGGSGRAGDWTIAVSREGGALASPNFFQGQASPGTTVTIPAGKGYAITDDNAVAAYTSPESSSGCFRADGGPGLAPGTLVTCTITRYDMPRVTVVTDVNGGPLDPSDIAMSISGSGVSPSSFSGTQSGRSVVVGNNAPYAVDGSNPADYVKSSSGACAGSLSAITSTVVTCTFTYDYQPPPSNILLSVLPLPALRRRSAWPSNRAG